MNLTIAIAQINPTIGDIVGNAESIRNSYRDAVDRGADLVVCPELSLIGYPPQDLLHRNRLIRACHQAVEQLAGDTGPAALVVGTPRRELKADGRLYNALAVLRNGEIQTWADKSLLPTYDVFDEARYFQANKQVQHVELQGQTIGLTICEDLWPDAFRPDRVHYDTNPVEQLKEMSPDLVINIAASPYWIGKREERENIFTDLAADVNAPVVYCNTIGANDEIIFDGRSLIATPDGSVAARAPSFEEDLLVFDPETDSNAKSLSGQPEDTKEQNVLRALQLGLRDYVQKCGFERVLLGLSGGIDSSMTACVAARALGPERVMGVSMPTRYTSDESRSDAERLADNLGISFREIEIESIFRTFMEELEPIFDGEDPGTAAENLQARIRGTLLMTLSNFTGRLLLATGNKSELSVGYCTLYGDMAGGIAPIGDVPKTLVYDLASHVNEQSDETVIPERILTKPPSAELRPDQSDQDALPPYDQLDNILNLYIEQEQDLQDIVREESEAVVEDVIQRVDRNEFKRQQAAPVLKVTSRAFGIGRHMPIAKRVRYEESETN